MLKRMMVAFGLGVVTLLPAGCNIVGPAYYFIHGPEKTKKVYTLDEEKTAVVFVDDRQNKVPRRALRAAMAEEAEKTLLQKRVVKDMVSANSALVAAGNDKHGKPLPVTEIGKAVQAETVIFATIDKFSLTPDGSTYQPEVLMRVKVVSVAEDKRLWPDGGFPEGYPLRVRLRAEAKEVPTSVSGRYGAEDALARQAGLEIAWLFFDHDRATGPRVPD